MDGGELLSTLVKSTRSVVIFFYFNLLYIVLTILSYVIFSFTGHGHTPFLLTTKDTIESEKERETERFTCSHKCGTDYFVYRDWLPMSFFTLRARSLKRVSRKGICHRSRKERSRRQPDSTVP